MPPLTLLGDRVRLEEFAGCVGTSAGAAALASVAHEAHLHIHMAAPLDLSALGGTYKDLCESCPARGAAPLGPWAPYNYILYSRYLL